MRHYAVNWCSETMCSEACFGFKLHVVNSFFNQPASKQMAHYYDN